MPKSMVKEHYLTLNYQMPRALYDRAKKIITAGLQETLEGHSVLKLGDHYIDITLFNWGRRELVAERRRADMSKKLKSKVRLPEWSSQERMITCTTKVGEQRYYEALSDLRLMYPEIYYDRQGSCIDFIGYLGTRFARRVKNGDVELSSALYQIQN